MREKQQKLVIGCLLHDFGKLLYRYNDGRNHSISGYDFLKELSGLKNEKDILNCVRYHHGNLLKNADVEKNDICYITYIADNIAAATDRRAKESSEGGFVRNIASESIFNILNGNREQMIYKPRVMSEEMEINYPVEGNIEFTEAFYSKIVDNIKNAVNGIYFTNEYIDSLIQILEANLTFVPSSTQIGELRDISLYDHLKLTAAFGLCIEQYLEEKNITDYKTTLFNNALEFYNEKAFRLYSLDISGIQDFIYNIGSKSALKGLRARSFYLELLMENSVDELLLRANLCRANVMYTGGGHTYIIMPATENISKIIKEFETDLNNWFMEMFGSALYAAGGYADCSSNELKNVPKGSYKEIFSKISEMISNKKLKRYNSENILKFNAPKEFNHTRECNICNRSDMLNDDDECSVCNGLKKLSDMIIDTKNSFFAVVRENYVKDNKVPLPFGYELTAYSWNDMGKVIQNSNGAYVRAYSKNKLSTGVYIVSNLWVGDCAKHKDFSKIVSEANGVKRLAVIRADVDSLGQAFVSGFTEADNEGKYETITRTAVFSRKLSAFFKLHINQILKNGEFQLFNDKKSKERNAVIVYAGGDDLFIVGGWDDILCFAIDMYNSLKKFTQGTLTISAGIGIYPEKIPISAMAENTGRLEEASKSYDNESKNAITLFDEDNTYHWQELIDEVIGEKLNALQDYIKNDGEHAKAMLYKMLQLIRDKGKENRLNIARFMYLIARLKPKKENAKAEQIEAYNKFAKKLYQWIQNEKDSKQLITAIYIYVYMNREGEGEAYEEVR